MEDRPIIYGVVEEGKTPDGTIFPVAAVKIDPLANCVTYMRIFVSPAGLYRFEAVMN